MLFGDREKRSEMLSFRVSKRELKVLRRTARARGISVTKLIRQGVLALFAPTPHVKSHHDADSES